MNFNFHTNHRLLLSTIALGFLLLSTAIAIIPAYQVQNNNPPLSGSPALTDAAIRGRMVYVSEGCQACHTQQVRSNVIDQPWGSRPSVPADYATNERMNTFRNTASLLGSERTGPDLTNIGIRQPGDTWHLLHLYNPRAVVKESIMPAYPWLFHETKDLKPADNALNIPDEYAPAKGIHVIPSQRVKDLISYLQSLKQQELPEYLSAEFTAYEWQEVKSKSELPQETLELDGAKLYSANCKVCHQDNGKGLKGAFPSLDQSAIVNNSDPTEMIKIVLYGIDRDNEYGAMLPFGEKLSDEEIAAIISFERSGWSNKSDPVTAEEVKAVRNEGKPTNWPL